MPQSFKSFLRSPTTAYLTPVTAFVGAITGVFEMMSWTDFMRKCFHDDYLLNLSAIDLEGFGIIVKGQRCNSIMPTAMPGREDWGVFAANHQADSYSRD